MPTIKLKSQFKKDFKKLSVKEKAVFAEKLLLFLTDSEDPILRDHKLHGKLDKFRSFNIDGDLRVLYYADGDIFRFVRVASHSQLY